MAMYIFLPEKFFQSLLVNEPSLGIPSLGSLRTIYFRAAIVE